MGSYTFMRGWSLIFKGYAGEQIMFKLFGVGEPVKLEWQMAFYVILLYITFTASSLVQFSVKEKHAAMQKEVKQ